MQLGNYTFDPEVATNVAVMAGKALAILIVTWLLAKAAKWAFARLVDKIAFLQRGTSGGTSVGESLGKIVSLFIWLFGLLGILQVLGLDGVAEPINNLLNNMMALLPNLFGAGLLLFIGLMIAGIVRALPITAMQTIDLDSWASRGGQAASPRSGIQAQPSFTCVTSWDARVSRRIASASRTTSLIAA